MYNTRIKQWKICKNYRAQDKDALAARILHAHEANKTLSDITLNDRPVKIDRVLRYCRTQLRKQRTQAPASQQPEITAADDSSTYQEQLPRAHHTSEQEISNSSPKMVTPTSLNGRLERSALTKYSYARPLSTPTDSANIELLLQQTQALYPLIAPDSIPCSARPLTNFWTDIKSAIYFLKKNTPHLAWPLLNIACRASIKSLISTPVQFLRELFSTT